MKNLFLYFFIMAGSVYSQKIFNVKDYGATGNKEGSARASIQKAIDACAANGGGMVYLPPGQYSSGTIHLKSNIRFYIEAGATLYSIKDSSAFDKDALIYGDSLQNISIEGKGTIDGQARYEWRVNDIEDDLIRANKDMMVSLGKPLMRSFPKRNQYGHLLLLLRCKDVRITGLSFIDSPSWTINLYACERIVMDGLYVHSDTKYGVWADGIDPDGCKDLRISNCTVETGDDALVFWSYNIYGPALPCENITVTNCRFTSASSGIKFCDGNMSGIRNVTIDNCVIKGANRGIAFMDFDGGEISDIVLSNLTIDCIRYDWFWWGDGDPLHFNVKRRSQISKGIKPEADKPAGKIQRVLISNVIARGKGSSICNGHPDTWMEDITVNNLKLYIAHDPQAPFDKAVHALEFKQVKNLKLKNVDIFWDSPESPKWESALYLEDIDGLEVDDLTARQAKTGANTPAVVFSQVENAVIRNSTAQAGTGTFLNFIGDKTKNILVYSNNFTNAKIPFTKATNVGSGAIRSEMNFTQK